MANTKLSLEQIEQACFSRDHEKGGKVIFDLLLTLDRNYGQLGVGFKTQAPKGILKSEIDQHLLARIASALTTFFSDPKFSLSAKGFNRLMPLHRWLASIFAASPFRNTDHIIRQMNLNGPDSSRFNVTPRDFLKFCLLYSPESEIPLNLDALWSHNKAAAASLFLTLMSPRFLGTPEAHSKRELLLTWLPQKLIEIESLDLIPLAILHDVYMHCSYADTPNRHDIKKSINVLIRNKLDDLNIRDLKPTFLMKARQAKHTQSGKPVMLVLMEWFTGGHSIYRTHSLSLAGAQQYFHLVGVGYENAVDSLGRSIFNEFISIPVNTELPVAIKQLVQLAEEHAPAVFYMPSLGMFPITMYMANLRLAPTQIIGLGHPATSHSNKIDLVSVESDFIGDPACFSEALMRLPNDGQPYRPSASFKVELPSKKKSNEVIKVAIAATTMKLNPGFLRICQKIAKSTTNRFEFHFLVGQSHGLAYPQVKALINRYLTDAVIYPHQPYEAYMEKMNECHMFLSPFPFGNTNGIVDAALLNLPGVNLSGREVFEHIDEGLFKRMGLPDWLTARNADEYVASAVRLIDDNKTREQITAHMKKRRAVENLFKGNSHAFGESCFRHINTGAVN